MSDPTEGQCPWAVKAAWKEAGTKALPQVTDANGMALQVLEMATAAGQGVPPAPAPAVRTPAVRAPVCRWEAAAATVTAVEVA